MFHLAAYVALARRVRGQRVVVIRPRDARGPRLLRDAGAALVLALDATFAGEHGIEVRPMRGGALPLRDQSVDMTIMLESFAVLTAAESTALLQEARRVLRPAGTFAAWTRQPRTPLFGLERDEGGLDFYGLEDRLAGVFENVRIYAQMPWQGFAVTAVPEEDEDPGDAALVLDEGLLLDAPEASHYLALGSRVEIALDEECTLVPVPDEAVFVSTEAAPPDDLLDELDRLREELSLRAAKSGAAHARIRELERELRGARDHSGNDEDAAAQARILAATEALERARANEAQLSERAERIAEERSKLEGELARTRKENARLEHALERAESAPVDPSSAADVEVLTKTLADRDRALDRAQSDLERLRGELDEGKELAAGARKRLEALDAERVELRRQLDVMAAEGDGARKLAARVEAELEVLRKRYAEQNEQLSSKREESSRLAGEMAVFRARLTEAEKRLDESRARASELTATAAQGAERGRALTEVARDRDRLREELTQRTQHIDSLEEKLWEARERHQQEKLEAVRLTAEVERLRAVAERSKDMERRRATEIEALNGELRQLEVQRIELDALVRQRDESIQRMVEEAQRHGGASAGTLEGELERLRAEVARVEARNVQAAEREQQLRDAIAGNAAEVEANAEARRAAERALEQDGAKLARARADVEEREQELASVREALATAESELETVRARGRELERARGAAEEQARAAVASDAERLSKLEQMRGELDAAAEERDRLRASLESAGADRALRDEVAGLRSKLRARDDELTRIRAAPVVAPDVDGTLGLEIEVRRAEQEVMLAQLDSAEQRIWEMTDAADRNAARFEASLAQLEKQKDRVDQLMEELEVTRALLSAEQARTLEQERLLASERAKLARAGLGLEGFPRGRSGGETTEGVFAELNPNRSMVSLNSGPASPPVPAPVLQTMGAPMPVDDRSGQGASYNHLQAPPRPKPPLSVLPNRARMFVEEAQDDEWEED